MAAPELRSDKRFEALFAKRPDMIKPGLDRIRRGVEALTGEGISVPSVLVGGTNGKGSTSGFLWRLLAACDVRTGLFTSPHLVHFSERFCLSNQRFDDDDAAALLESVRRDLPEALYTDLSFFEVATLMALRLFARSGCGFNVFEVGMGGRWDATNITDPLISAIVSIGKDHTQYLGESLGQIAREKAGIIRPGRPVFCGIGDELPDGQPNVALGVIEAAARDAGAPLIRAGRHFGVLPGGRFYCALPELPRFESPLPADVQDGAYFLRENFALAAAMCWWLIHSRESGLGVAPRDASCVMSRALVRFGEPETPWPPSLWGRSQRCVVEATNGHREVLLDVGHNVDGAKALARAVAEKGGDGRSGRRPGMVSILKDKDVNGVLDILRGFLDPIVLFRIDNERSFRPEDIAERHRDIPMHESFDEAWARVAGGWQWRADSSLVICGSVAAVGEVMRYFGMFEDNHATGRVVHGRSPCAWGRGGVSDV